MRKAVTKNSKKLLPISSNSDLEIKTFVSKKAGGLITKTETSSILSQVSPQKIVMERQTHRRTKDSHKKGNPEKSYDDRPGMNVFRPLYWPFLMFRISDFALYEKQTRNGEIVYGSVKLY